MSINRRTAIAVRSIGVASAAAALALGVAGSAFACNIGEFSAKASCDKGTGKASFDITDLDHSQPATVTVLDNGTVVATTTFEARHTENTVNVPFDWKAGTTYTVHVKAGTAPKYVLDQDVQGGVTAPAEACTAPEQGGGNPSPSTSAAPTPTDSASAAPTATTTAPAAAVDDTNAPKPAAGGQSNLAETGGGSNTGMIAGVAAALVVAGGGTVFFMRRRKPAAHN